MILIDAPTRHVTNLRYKVWSHLVSTVDADELHAFAAQLGLRRTWFQSRAAGRASADHYDVTAGKFDLAVQLGAVVVSGRELVCRNYDGLRRRGVLPQLPEFVNIDEEK